MRQFLISLITILFFMAQNTDACSCFGPGPAEKEFKGADAVFVGKVIAVAQTDFRNHRHFLSNIYSFEFEVISSWKGVTQRYVTVKTPEFGGACGYWFPIGHEFLVYAYEYQGAYYTNICTRTAPLKKGITDVQSFNTEPLTSEDLVQNKPALFFLDYRWLMLFVSLIFVLIHLDSYQPPEKLKFLNFYKVNKITFLKRFLIFSALMYMPFMVFFEELLVKRVDSIIERLEIFSQFIWRYRILNIFRGFDLLINCSPIFIITYFTCRSFSSKKIYWAAAIICLSLALSYVGLVEYIIHTRVKRY